MADLKKAIEDARADGVETQISDADFRDLSRKIDAAISRIQSLRNDVEALL